MVKLKAADITGNASVHSVSSGCILHSSSNVVIDENLHAEQHIHASCLLHVSHLSLSVASPSLSAACRFLHSLLLLFSSCTLYQSVSLSFVYMTFSFFFPVSKLITERVLMGNPVEKKSILSHTKSRFLLSCHFCCFSFSLFLLLPLLWALLRWSLECRERLLWIFMRYSFTGIWSIENNQIFSLDASHLSTCLTSWLFK